MKLKTFWQLLSILVLLLLSTNIVFACKCASGRTQIDKFNDAEYVALIRVMAIEIRPTDELSPIAQQLLEEWGIGQEYIRVSYEAKEIFKGIDVAPNYLMENPIQGGGNCALDLKLGRLYVVFLRKELMGLVMDCLGTFEFYNTDNSKSEDTKLKLLRDLSKSGR